MLNFPHQAFQAAKFNIKFFDANNNLLACPQFQVYYATPGGAVGINNFQQTPGTPGVNIGGQHFPVSYAPWQTVGLDLSAYMGQTISMQIECDWCIYNYDWAYCYIDADCYGTYNAGAAACGNMPFNLCGPMGMQNYTWTIPGGSQSFSSCVTALSPGIYTLQTSPYNTCGPVVFTYTYDIQPRPTAAFVSTVTPCTGSVNFQSTSLNNGGPAITSTQWQWMDASPNGTGTAQTHTFNTPGTHSVQLVVTGATGCKDSIIQTFTITPPVSFTLNNITNTNTITCLTPTINYSTTTNYTFGALTYSWSSPSFTAGTPSVALTQAGNYTITELDPATGCTQTQLFTIGVNTVAPTSSVAPSTQVITCATVSAATFTGTAITPTTNFTQSWYGPISPPPAPPVSSCGTSVCPFQATAPGVYTVVTCNNFNGCCTPKTVTVTSIDAFPTFSLNSPTNYSIGCNPINQTTISVINALSTQTPAGVCSYTFLPPGFGGVVSPSVPLSGNNSTITQTPGTWTVIVQDNSNFCRTIVQVPVIQNTVGPQVDASMLTQTLTCYNPTVLATGTSTTPGATVQWIQITNNLLVTQPTIQVGPATGPPTSSTSLLYGTYTVVSTNSINACKTTSLVLINQNFRPPVSSPLISTATPTAIFCNALKNPAVLTTGASTVTSGVPNDFVANPTWSGPSPQATISGPSTYSCYIAGVYTLEVMDNYNGCKTTATINVLDKTQPPVLGADTVKAKLDCGSNTATILTTVSGSSTNLMYWYIQYPTGAAFLPQAAPIPNGGNPLFSGTNSNSVSVSLTGLYQYLVSNTLTGCIARGNALISNGNLNVDFTPDVVSGYPPLTVNFANNSSSSLGSSSITSVWSFGNGTTETTTTNIGTSATYAAPGTYTVVLLGAKGTCLDTSYKVIIVEIPSKLEVPNVFTPNGDGSNDVFFLKTANLTEITALIYDRWGNKVYETTSASGNIGWDGKNLHGKDCSDGTYFYIIKAKGGDSKAFETKGTVSIFR